MGDLGSYEIRPMRRSEATFLKAMLKEDGGITSSREDIDTWRAVDGDAFLVAVHEGKIVGCCVAFKFGADQGHIGMALPPSGDHAKIIPKLFGAAQDRLSGRRMTFTIRADQMSPYQNLGLNQLASYKWILCSLKCPKDLKVFRATHVYRTLALTEPTMIERVIDYDATLHAYDNREVMKQTLAEIGCTSRVFVGNKEVSGYACLRRLFTGGWRVSPIVAEDGGGALCLLTDLLMALTSAQLEEGVSFFIPSDNDIAVDLAKTMGFSIMEVNERVTLSNRGFEGPTPSWLYAIHTPTYCLF